MFGNVKETSVAQAAKPQTMNKITAFNQQKNAMEMVERPVISRKLQERVEEFRNSRRGS